MSRLPQVNSDKGNWGRILNTWLKHIAGYRGVTPARPASGSLPAGVAINGTGYDTTDQFQSENSGLNFHNDFPSNVPNGFTFIHTLHNRIYRREGNDWAILLEGVPSSNPDWSLTGNAGTNPNSNFLGTTDAQPLVIRTSNTERVRIDTNGNLGIGIATPAQRLDVNGNVQFSGALMPNGDAGTSGQVLVSQGSGQAPVWQTLNTGDQDWLIAVNSPTGVPGSVPDNVDQWIYTNGNLGIGTNSPTAQFHTTGTVRLENYASGANGALLRTDSSGDLSLINFPGSTDEVLLGNATFAALPSLAWTLSGNSGTDSNNDFLGTTDNVGLTIRTNNTARMFITPTGDVGIGTTTPASRLNVHDGHLAITNSDNTARELRLYEPSGAGTNFTAFRAQAQDSDITYILPSSLTPGDNISTGILQTDASGNLSWLNPSALLSNAGSFWSLTGNSGTNPNNNFLGTIDNQPLVIRTSNTERVRIDTNGNVGIGTTTPGRRLDVVDELSVNNNLLTQIEGGLYYGRVRVSENQWALSNVGATWTERTGAGARGWHSVSLSSDGKYQTAVVYNGYIYTSSDYGATWTERTDAGSRYWRSVSISSDGKYQTAVAPTVPGFPGGYIYTSSDYGATWTQITGAGVRNWFSVSISSDGKYQTAVEYAGYIYTSSDYGATWTARTGVGLGNWWSVSLSSDGKYQTAVAYNGYIYTSSDYGATWTARTGAGSRYWTSVSLSSDGKYQTAVVTGVSGFPGGYIYTSSDYGATWTARTGAGARYWASVSISSDGKYQTAVVGTVFVGYIYTSSDYGATWTARTGAGARGWASISISSDGKYQTAVAYGGYIYTSSADSYIFGGNVGIGTTNPGAKLDVRGVVGTDSVFGFSNFQQTASPYDVYISAPVNQSMGLFTRGVERVRINHLGNVGIGTTTPTNALHVSRFGFNPSQNDAAAIRVEGNVGGGIVFSEGNNRSAIYSPAGSDLVFATGGSSGGIPGRVHIDSIGRVGVNTSPWLNATLTVSTPSSHINNAPLSNWGNSPNAYLRTFGQMIYGYDAVNYSQSRANSSSSISAFRREALFVVNSYSTSAKTYMNGVITALTEGPNPNHPNAGILALCETHMCMQTGPVHPQGNWGVPMIDNPSNPTNSFVGFYCKYDLSQVPNNCRPLFINCFSSDSIVPNSNNTGHFVVHGRGHMYLYSADSGGAIAYKNGTTTWVNPSDARLKTNIRPITGALEKIGQLRGVSFDWINQDLHKGDPTSGFLAQEMEKVFPDCVNEVDSPAGDNADSKLTGGKIKTVGLTAGFFATMVEAIKEQQRMIEQQTELIEQQQQKLQQQEQWIAGQQKIIAEQQAKLAILEQKYSELESKLNKLG